MNVKQLISQLNKMPQDLEVFCTDHDQGEYETTGKARDVIMIDKSLVPDIRKEGFVSYAGINDKSGHVSVTDQERFDHTPKIYIVIRT